MSANGHGLPMRPRHHADSKQRSLYEEKLRRGRVGAGSGWVLGGPQLTDGKSWGARAISTAPPPGQDQTAAAGLIRGLPKTLRALPR